MSIIFQTPLKKLENFWLRKYRPLFFLFYPLSILYGFLIFCRRFLYAQGFFKTYISKVPVWSIGNLQVGGVGKTPFISYLLENCLSDQKVAVLHSGYGGGDEAKLLQHRHPKARIFCGRKRHLFLKQAEGWGADLILLDDGMQCFRIKRDLEIVLLDANNLFDNKSLLPAGKLRERPSALARAHQVVVNHLTDGNCHPGKSLQLTSQIRRYSAAPILFMQPTFVALKNSQHQEMPMQLLEQKPWAIFCGIGQPKYFLDMLQKAGVDIKVQLQALDHETPSPAVWKKFMAACQSENVSQLLCTEKDFWRIQKLKPPMEIFYICLCLQTITAVHTTASSSCCNLHCCY